MFKCPKEDCDNQYEKVESLCKHWSRHKDETKAKLYLQLNSLDKEPTCKCGCGGEVAYLDISRGFREFIHGHAARVSNNFQTENSVKKSKATRKKMHQEGQIKIWNAGLTGDMDERVALYGKLGGETIRSNPQELERRSKRLSRGRKDGTVPTLSGPDSPAWKGGVSSLNQTCRANGNLYRKWTRKHQERARFVCENCGASGVRIEVHHDKESFSSILRSFAKEFCWTKCLTESIEKDDPILDSLKQQISEAVANYHIDNNISGIVLCVKCHKKHHGSYNL